MLRRVMVTSNGPETVRTGTGCAKEGGENHERNVLGKETVFHAPNTERRSKLVVPPQGSAIRPPMVTSLPVSQVFSNFNVAAS